MARRFIYYLWIFANVPDEKIKKDVKSIFFEVFPKLSENEFAWEKEQKDYDSWDSFAQLNMITFAESKFDVSFSHVYLVEENKIKQFRQFTDAQKIQESLN